MLIQDKRINITEFRQYLSSSFSRTCTIITIFQHHSHFHLNSTCLLHLHPFSPPAAGASQPVQRLFVAPASFLSPPLQVHPNRLNICLLLLHPFSSHGCRCIPACSTLVCCSCILSLPPAAGANAERQHSFRLKTQYLIA